MTATGGADHPEASAERPYHHGNLREAVLAAAVDALSRKEPTEVSLRDLARTVGVRHSALYTHFRDRDELLSVIAGEGFRALAEQLSAALDQSHDPLAALATTYLHFARANAAYYRVMFRPENVSPENRRHTEAAADHSFDMLMRVLMEQRALSQDEALDRAVGIWSMLHGLITLGGDRGPLCEKVSRDKEAALAAKLAHAIARTG